MSDTTTLNVRESRVITATGTVTRYRIWREEEVPTRWGWWRTRCVYDVLRSRPRVLTLIEPLTFEDARGRWHEVPAGTESDGASMSRVRVFGVPVAERLLGSGSRPEFRRASFLHDRQCVDRVESPLAVHARYGPALAADGVDLWRAGLMGAAVLLGGPTW